MDNLIKSSCRKRKPLRPSKVKDRRPVAQRICDRDQRIARARLLEMQARERGRPMNITTTAAHLRGHT